MRSQRIISRSFITFCLLFVVMLTGLVFIARNQTGQIIDRLSIDRVLAARQGFFNYLEDLSEKAMLRANILSSQERLINLINQYKDNDLELTDELYEGILDIADEFLFGYDFISISDENGTALARVDSGWTDYPLPPNGYSLMANPDVRMVFETGEPVTALTFMLDNTTLVATALYPIYDNDEIIGIVTCLFDLTNPRYLQGFKEQSGSEVAVFLGTEEFISTFVSRESHVIEIDGEDVEVVEETRVKVVAAQAAIDAIFEDKDDLYISYKTIGDITYGTGFSGLVYHGEIIGMVLVGVDVHTALSIQSDMDSLIMFIAIIGIIIALVSVIIIIRYNAVIKKQIRMQNLMTRISQSFLSDEDIGTLITKAFSELGAQIKVTQILLYVSKEGYPGTYECTNDWIDPSYNRPFEPVPELHISDELLATFINLKGKEKFYITSEEVQAQKVMSQYRVNFQNFLTTNIFIDDRVYAIIDFAREKNGKKWHKDDINAASFLSNILTSAFHRKEVEKQLITARDIAEQSSNYKTAFLANVSHEIRTPMNAILGIAEIYLQDPAARENIDEGLGMIYDSGNLLLGIVNDILDLSKIEAGKMEIFPAVYDIPSLINDSVQVCRLRYGSKPIEFVLDIDKQTPLNLFGDELRIKQVLNNILSNAFKYTDSGEIKLSVTAQPDEHNDDEVILIFRVSDTGQGMTPEQLEVLFNEFTRFNMEINRATVGTGLGMSITKRLLDLMGGEVLVDSYPGIGSTFTVRLPQKRIGTETCGPDMSEQLNDFNYHSITLTKRTQVICEYMPYGSVLVVDDVESNLYVAKGMLIPYGLKIETATSGYEAIDYISNGKTYDIIFMDHMMPKMDGVEAVRNIRQMGYEGCIIALTADAIVGQAEMFMENGFDSYIPKPIDTRELNAMLNEYIRNRKPTEVVNAAREEARERELLKTLETGRGDTPGGQTSDGAGDNKEDDDAEVREYFLIDARQALNVLEEEYSNYTETDEMDIDSFRISAHGMKSALRHVGENELSDSARSLEEAAVNLDYDYITEKAPEFIDALRALIEKMS